LYDSVANSVISSTQNTILNGKLYAKLLVSLEDQAFQHMTSRKPFSSQWDIVTEGTPTDV
jgi:hypothetical protein